VRTVTGTLFCNVLWFLECLPDALAFGCALCFPRHAQQRVLRRILRHNANTEVGRRCGFARMDTVDDYAAAVPVSEYRDYAGAIEAIRRDPLNTAFTAERVRVLEPTSGTGNAPKLIPYTASLQRDFLAAIHPWLAGLYLRAPSLFLARQYWSISPNTRIQTDESKTAAVRIGFENDDDYLGAFARRLSQRLMAVPGELAQVTDTDAFEYLTLLFLVREPALGLVSVWHPSFFTLLIDKLPTHWPELIRDICRGEIKAHLSLPPALRHTLQGRLRPSPRRAKRLGGIDISAPHAPAAIWPRLRVISCWTEGCAAWIERLQSCFPRAIVQAKGLVATEGIVTIPVGTRRNRTPAAVRSHFLEFMDRSTNRIKRVWELEPGCEYIVLLTTGGGLYRYCLHDRVTVSGRILRTPCLRFTGREGCVSDMVGEKVDLLLAEQALAAATAAAGQAFGFAMLAPDRPTQNRCGYIWFIQAAADAIRDWAELTDELERQLQRGYHYRHARRLGQLAPLRLFALTGCPEAEYREQCARGGTRLGDVKLSALSLRGGWDKIFTGHFVATADEREGLQ
jgi:hypothetical protein